MSEVVIEKGIPIPKRGNGSRWVDALKIMGVGDSFTVANANELANALAAGRRLGVKTISRKYNGEIRIWRVE